MKSSSEIVKGFSRKTGIKNGKADVYVRDMETVFTKAFRDGLSVDTTAISGSDVTEGKLDVEVLRRCLNLLPEGPTCIYPWETILAPRVSKPDKDYYDADWRYVEEAEELEKRRIGRCLPKARSEDVDEDS